MNEVKHCRSYGCSLKPECICTCMNCKPVNSSICKTCGTCKECGTRTVPMEKEIVYVPYYVPATPVQIYNMYLCLNPACGMWHYYGYQCMVPWSITWTVSYTNVPIPNIGIDSNPNLCAIQVAGLAMNNATGCTGNSTVLNNFEANDLVSYSN
jgi:hypothetical protein